MTATTVRLKKEARALFWPWCALLIAGALPVILANSYTKKLCGVSFFVGVPMLAALAFGSEYQQRTFSLWVTQPLSRAQLWGEKMGVMWCAALSAGLVSGFGLFSFTWPELDVTWKMAAVAGVLAATASAPYFTLSAGSTLGGFALITFYLSAVCMLLFKIVPSLAWWSWAWATPYSLSG